VIKSYSVVVFLATLIAISSAGDWLEGGYVGQGSYSDTRQHFTDPIFYSSGSQYTSSDPAIRQMEESMDRYSSRYASLGSSNSKSTIGKSTIAKSASPSSAAGQPVNIAGSWHLELSDGTLIDLDLSQSGSRVFGLGSMTSAISSQWAVASGEVTGSSLSLDVVPASGMELYAISMDVSRLHLPGSYSAFKANAVQISGNVMANRVAANAAWTKHDTAKNAIGNVR
jgi:hypothetical protein